MKTEAANEIKNYIFKYGKVVQTKHKTNITARSEITGNFCWISNRTQNNKVWQQKV